MQVRFLNSSFSVQITFENLLLGVYVSGQYQKLFNCQITCQHFHKAAEIPDSHYFAALWWKADKSSSSFPLFLISTKAWHFHLYHLTKVRGTLEMVK